MAERIVVQAQFEAVVDSFKAEMAATRKRIDDVNRGIAQTNRQLRGFQDRLTRAGRSLRTFAVGFVGYGLVDGVRQLGQEFLETADTFRLAQDRIALFTSELGNSNEINQELFAISQRTRSALIPNVNAFARLSVAVKATSDNYQDLLNVVEAVNLTGALSGTGIQERTAVLTQLLQALGSNRLGGEELRAILEQDPRLTQILRGVSTQFNSSIREFAEQGGFTTDVVIEAIVGELATLRKEFENLPPTIAQVVQQLKNDLGKAALEFDGFFQITDRVVELLQSFQGILNTENLIIFSLGLIQFRDNILALVNPIRVIIQWVSNFTVAINALEFALHALPFIAPLRALTAGIRGLGALGQLGKAAQTGKFLPRGTRSLNRMGDLLSRLQKLDDATKTVDKSLTALFIGSAIGYGVTQSGRGINPLTAGLDEIIERQKDLDVLLPRVNKYLQEQGRIFEYNPTTKTGRVRNLTPGEKQRQLIDAHFEKLRQFRQEYLKEYGPSLAIIEREKELLDDRVEATEELARLEKLPERVYTINRISDLKAAVQKYNEELATLGPELDRIKTSEDFLTKSFAAFKKEAEKAAAEVAKLKAEITGLGDEAEEEVVVPVRYRPIFDKFARIVSPESLRTFFPTLYRELGERGVVFPVRLRPSFKEEARVISSESLRTFFPTLYRRLRERDAIDESPSAREARLRQEGEARDRLQQRLNILAAGYNRTLQTTQNILGQISRQVQGIVGGTTRWQDAIRNTIDHLAQLIAQLAFVEPLARRIADALNPSGANAAKTLRQLGGGLVGTITNPGGEVSRFTGVFNRPQTFNTFLGTPAMEWGIRRARSRGAQDVLGILMANPGAYK